MTPNDILKIFEDYQSDIVESMVFLKNIERVEFYRDEIQLGCINIRNPDPVRRMRASISIAISSKFVATYGTRVDVEREYGYTAEQIQNSKCLQTYRVQQRVFDIETYKMPVELRNWTAKNKAVNTIALSARLDETKSPSCFPVSRIFVTLPLPIPLDNTRVNINGMFALRRDRRSLWTNNDAHGGQTMNEILWNDFLIGRLTPVVWHDLLVNLAKYKTSIYEYFPLMPWATGSLFNNLADDVLQQLFEAKSAIWRSTTGQYMKLEMGFVAIQRLEQQLLNCLNKLGMPIFADIPDAIVSLIRRSQHSHTILSPKAVRIWLRQNSGVIKTCDVSMAMHILEYVSGDEQMDQLYELPLFVCRNKMLRSLSQKSQDDNVGHFRSKLYIGTLQESALFDENGEHFLLIEKYPQTVATRIQTHISLMTAALNLEMFNLHCFEHYSHDVLFSHPSLNKTGKDIIEMSLCKVDVAWIQKLWDWLDTQSTKEVERVVQSLWLIPLEGGKRLYKVQIYSFLD